MDFTLTPEQEQYRDTVRRCVEGLPLSPKGATAESYAATWRTLAELGVFSLCVAEDHCGLSGEAEDVALIASEFGRSPTSTIRLETAVGSIAILSAAGSNGQELLERLIAGDVQPALSLGQAHEDPPILLGQGTGFAVSGTAQAVVGGESSEVLIAAVRTGDGQGLAIVAVDLVQPGVTLSAYRLFDTTPVADIHLDKVSLSEAAVLVSDDAESAISSAQESMTLAICASLLGGMECASEKTIEYLKTRQQFGHPLADLQALQHQVADMFMLTNDARSSLYRALAASRGSARERTRAIAGCRVKVADASKQVTGQAVHLHGGIGFTTEYIVGHLFRRAMVDDLLLPSRDACISARQSDARDCYNRAWREAPALHIMDRL